MMDFVWIYIHSPSDYAKTGRFYELDYSIRSVKKNYKDCRCIVVGDDPELEGVLYVPCERIETSKYGYYRHFDQIKKLLTAMQVVKDEFILMYDDIYILNPVTRKDLTKVYAKAKIDDIEKYLSERKGDNAYKRCWHSTMNRIREFRDDLYDWETHLPRYMRKEEFLLIVKEYNLEKVDYLSYSLYAAMFRGTPEILNDTIQASVLEYAPLHTEWDKVFSAKFMDTADNGISQEFINEMKLRFG